MNAGFFGTRNPRKRASHKVRVKNVQSQGYTRLLERYISSGRVLATEVCVFSIHPQGRGLARAPRPETRGRATGRARARESAARLADILYHDQGESGSYGRAFIRVHELWVDAAPDLLNLLIK